MIEIFQQFCMNNTSAPDIFCCCPYLHFSIYKISWSFVWSLLLAIDFFLIAGMKPKKVEIVNHHPPSRDVLQNVGLETLRNIQDNARRGVRKPTKMAPIYTFFSEIFC